MNYMTYEEAVKLLKDYFADCECEECYYAIEKLSDLLFAYEHRLADAELLNKLRQITSTHGDLDLKAKVKELMGKEATNDRP